MLRIVRDQSLTDNFRRLRDKFAEMMLGDVRSAGDGFRQPVIAKAFFDEHLETGIRNGRAGIIGEGAEDVDVAFYDQLVGDLFGELWTCGDGEEMLLPFAGDAIEERVVVQRI